MVAHTTDVVSPVDVSVAHTRAPCQPAPTPLRFADPAAAATFRRTFHATGPGLYEVTSRTRPGRTHIYDAVDDRCGCEATRSCWHRDLYLALTLDLDQADALIAASVIEPVAEIEVVDPVLFAAATPEADSAEEPAPCGWKDLGGRCHSAANGTFGQGVYCLPHAWDAYGLGLLDWANARPSTAVSNRTPALDLPAPSPDARLCPGCGQPAADGGYTHCTVNRATRRSYCGARAGDLLEAFGG